MSLNVVLIDKSEVIKKMLSHCLHYYSAEIHRVENLEDLKNHQPDLIFIDWDLKQGEEPLAVSAGKNIKQIPYIVIYRNEEDAEIKSIKNKIKKPLDANLLREMVANLVPKIGQSTIHNFLKFPNHSDSQADSDADPQTDSDAKNTPPQKANEKRASKTKAKTFLRPEDLTLEEDASLNPIGDQTSSAPLQKSSPSSASKSNNEKDEMILKILSEYKNTLGFEKILDQSLQKYAQKITQKILEKDDGSLLKQSISDLKKEEGFKNLILQTLSEYVREHSVFRTLFEEELRKFIAKDLPTLTKKVIEKEIKKILEDNS
ncbi:MAG: hypothetical protein ACR2M7_03145 [Bdellovibrionales bacterium]